MLLHELIQIIRKMHMRPWHRGWRVTDIHMVVCVDDNVHATYNTGPETAAALYETCKLIADG